MQLFVLLVLLAATPTVQEPAGKAADETVITLPSRQLPPVLLGTLVFPTPAKPYPSSLELSLAFDQTKPTDPIGRRGGESFSMYGPGLTVRLDRKRLHLDVEGSAYDRTFKQARLDVTSCLLLLNPGRFGIGLELDYRLFSFDRLAATVDGLELSTSHSGQLLTVGVMTRWRASRHIIVLSSLTVGDYFNRYTSSIALGQNHASESLADEQLGIGQTQIAVQTGPIFGRIRLSGLGRYSRLLRQSSSWAPLNEWSGEVAIDMRVVGSEPTALYLGAKARLNSRQPSLAADNSVDLHMSLLIR